MFVSQDLWREADVSLTPALSPTTPFIPTPTPPPLLATPCGHIVVCKQGLGLDSFHLVYLRIEVFCT